MAPMSQTPPRPLPRRLARPLLGVGLLGIGLLAACGGRGAAGWAVDRVVDSKFAVQSADTDTLAARLAGPEPPLLLDVREPHEYAVSHLPAARNLPPGADPASVLADVPRDRPVVVYCSVGWRSADMARRMAAAGFSDVTNMRGSIFRWVAQGRPLVDGRGAPTTRVHAFGPPWSWLVPPVNRAPGDP